MKYAKKKEYRDITQRFCPKIGDNVIVERHIGDDHDEFTCISRGCYSAPVGGDNSCFFPDKNGLAKSSEKDEIMQI